MAKLYFHYATMNAGKSSLLLQANHNYTSQGMRTLLLSSVLDVRSGVGAIKSRIGIEAACLPTLEDTNLFEIIAADVKAGKAEGNPLRCVFVDEAQFLHPRQVVELSRAVDDLGVPVMCYGLRTDFMGSLFPGSEALFRLSDEIREARSVCWCGSRATMVLRLDSDGKPMESGEQIAVGGSEMYASVCRKHWFARDTGRSEV